MLKEMNENELLDKLLGMVLEHQKLENYCWDECGVDIYCDGCKHEREKWDLDDKIDEVNSELYRRKFPVEKDEDESED